MFQRSAASRHGANSVMLVALQMSAATPSRLEQLARGDDFTSGSFPSEQLNPQLFLRPLAEQVHALEIAAPHPGHRGAGILVH